MWLVGVTEELSWNPIPLQMVSFIDYLHVVSLLYLVKCLAIKVSIAVYVKSNVINM